MTTDGGHNAIKGFIVQSIAALLESLEHEDWSELTVEPMSQDEDFQKVDIQWKLKDGRIRVAQVKSSRNRINVTDAKNWASELKNSYKKADEYILLLYAPVTGGVCDLDDCEGVKIKPGHPDISTLEDALALRAIKCIGHIKQCNTVSIKLALELLVGKVFVTTIKRKRWTPEDLKNHLLSLIDSCQQSKTIKNLNLQVSLLRIVKNISHGRSEEYVCYTFTNHTNKPVPIPRNWKIFWTDVGTLENLGVWEPPIGQPAYQLTTDESTGHFELEIHPSTIIPPKKNGKLEVQIQRKQLIQPIGIPPTAWCFRDPLLCTSSAHQADIYVIFPCEGVIEVAGPATKCSQIVHWELTTGLEQKELAATLQINPPIINVDEELLNRLNQYFRPTAL